MQAYRLSVVRWVFALLAVSLAPSAPASAQQATVLTEDLCTACSIELIPDLLLGADGESVIGVAWDIHRLPDGRFLMAFQDVNYEFTVFSADGSEFRRVGREGEGPGEYGHVWFVRERGGELHVFDRRRRRMTVLDPDFEVVRTSPVSCLDCNGFDMAALPGGAVAMNYFMASGPREEVLSAESGFAVHIVGPDGESLHSMDEIPTDGPLRPAENPYRFLEVAPDGSLLSLPLTSYRIDRWDPATGELLQTFVREADWFPAGQSYSHAAAPGRPPSTGTRAMQVDEAGRLWVYISRHEEGIPQYRMWRIRLEGRPGEGRE